MENKKIICSQHSEEKLIRPFVILPEEPIKEEVVPFVILPEEPIKEEVVPFVILPEEPIKEEVRLAKITTSKEEKKTIVEIDSEKDKTEKEEKEEKGAKIVTEVLETSEVANYKVIPVEKTVYFNRNGEKIPEKEKIRCKIWILGEEQEDFEILTADIANIAKIIGKRFSGAIVDFSVKSVERIIEADFRTKTHGIPCKCCFSEHGWQIINGTRIYLHDGCGINGKVETGLNLPKYSWSPEQIKNIFVKATNLYANSQNMSTMILFSLLGVTYKLFAEAGYRPHFLLFLSGKTGSMKTTIGKILFTQLAEDSHRDFPRRIDADTVVSFERAIVSKGRDTTILIDDYAPAKTPQKRMEMQNKLEAIIRMVGDGSTKSRSNQNLQDIQGEGVQGAVVLTGELRGKGVSSNLRCMYCELERDLVNTDMVTWFQENPYAYTTFIDAYVRYLSRNWKEIQSYIKNQFPVERKLMVKELAERRLIDSVAILHIIADILGRFLMDTCLMEQTEVGPLICEMKKGALYNAQISEALSVEDNPAVKFIKVVDSLLNQRLIFLYTKEEFIGKIGADGFMDDKYFYFVPEGVFEKVQKAIRATNDYFALDLHELLVCLYEEKVIKSYANGVGKRTYCARISIGKGKKQRFIKIPKEIFATIVDDNVGME